MLKAPTCHALVPFGDKRSGLAGLSHALPYRLINTYHPISTQPRFLLPAVRFALLQIVCLRPFCFVLKSFSHILIFTNLELFSWYNFFLIEDSMSRSNMYLGSHNVYIVSCSKDAEAEPGSGVIQPPSVINSLPLQHAGPLFMSACGLYVDRSEWALS